MVIDDLVAETEDRVTKLFTKKIHHLVHKIFLFRKGKDNRTINLNAQYRVLFKNARDATGVSRLAKKMYPRRVKYMLEASKDVTSVPYCYLLIGFKQQRTTAARSGRGERRQGAGAVRGQRGRTAQHLEEKLKADPVFAWNDRGEN